MIESPYFCESAHGRTGYHPTLEGAIAEACALKLAPFTIWHCAAQPIGVRQTNLCASARPIDPSRRYMGLDFSGADPHAIAAVEAYADSVESENDQLAKDIRENLRFPATAPSQHE